MRGKLILRATLAACLFCLWGSAASAQTILVYEDFELGTLPTGWSQWTGGANPQCSDVSFSDVGLDGLSLVASSNQSGCLQATGVSTDSVSIQGCSSVGVSVWIMDLGENQDSCPGAWTASSPPEPSAK